MEKEIEQLVDEIDFILIGFEDYMHDQEGKKITRARKILQELSKASNTVAPVDNIRWVSADIKPEYNVGVLVFIPDEDFHITSGMWDISNKWVLLDEYRVPDCEVTHWMPLVDIPDEYKKQKEDNEAIMDYLSKHKKQLK